MANEKTAPKDEPKLDETGTEPVAPAEEPAHFNPDNDGPVPPPDDPMDPPLPDTTDDAQKDNRAVNE